MPLTDKQISVAADYVCIHERLALVPGWVFRRDRKKIAEIAKIVFDRLENDKDTADLAVTNRKECERHLAEVVKGKVPDLNKMIPFWIGFVLQIIVSILIDWWFLNAKEGD